MKNSYTGAIPGPPRAQLRDLLTSFACANLSDGLLLVAVPLMAVSLSHSAFQVSLVSVARFVPWAFLAPAVGILVDRSDLRVTLIAASALRSVILVGVAVLQVFGRVDIAVLAAATLLIGVAEVVYDLSAVTALPAVCHEAGLESANSRQAMIREILDGLLGPALAGVLVAAGMPLAFGAGAGCYALAAVMALRLPRLTAVPRDRAGFRREMADGLRTLWRDPLLRVFLLMTTLGAFAFAGWQPVFSLFANAPGPVGLNSLRFGLVYSIGALGAAACSFSMRWLLAHVSRVHLLTCAKVIGPVSLILPVLWPYFAVAAAAMVGYSASVITWNVITVSYRQRRVPASMLGRINAAYRALAWGLLPVAPLLAGTISNLAHDNGLGMAAMGGLSCCAMLLLPAVWRNRADLNDFAADSDPAGNEAS